MPKKSIYYLVLIFFTIFITSSTFTMKAKAHSPQGIDLSYNANTQTLTATITHSVADNTTHFVISVIIQVNGSIVLTSPYTSQPDVLNFVYQYSIIADNGARIQATATCNQGGSISACIIVGGDSCEDDGGPGISGYLGLWLILGVSVIVLLTVIHRKLRNITT